MLEFLQAQCTLDNLGWLATALFAVSYMVKKELHLLYVQAFAALLWITYGWANHVMPVVLANAIVCGSATFKAIRINVAGKSLA